MKHYFFLLLLLGSTIANSQSINADSANTSKRPVVLVDGNLIDVETGKVRENISLLIENETD